MTTIAVLSVKHAPGVTTAAVALAAAYGEGALVVEADPSGGDIAARSRLTLEPGLLTLAAAGRRVGTALDFSPHLQALPGGGGVVVAPVDPDLARAAVTTTAPRLAGAQGAQLTIIDCGRFFAESPARPVIRSADVAVVVIEPTVAGVEHLRARVGGLDRPILGRLAVLLVGDRPYGAAEVEQVVGNPVVGSLAVDPRAVAALYAGSGARRSMLVRSARSALDAIAQVAPRAEALT
jgi:MinD-like ATPase involved in chromosome partitioning or flagellar assembly